MFDEIKALEAKLGLTHDFIQRIISEDDWSFIIKLNTLFEAVATHLLVSKLSSPELEDNLSYLDFGNSKFGKITLLKKLGCITADESRFLQLIFEIRNKLAHDIKYVNFDFHDHIASLDENQKKSFIKSVKCGKDTIYWNCEDQPIGKYILLQPKLLIFIVASEILISMHLQQSNEIKA